MSSGCRNSSKLCCIDKIWKNFWNSYHFKRLRKCWPIQFLLVNLIRLLLSIWWRMSICGARSATSFRGSIRISTTRLKRSKRTRNLISYSSTLTVTIFCNIWRERRPWTRWRARFCTVLTKNARRTTYSKKVIKGSKSISRRGETCGKWREQREGSNPKSQRWFWMRARMRPRWQYSRILTSVLMTWKRSWVMKRWGRRKHERRDRTLYTKRI